jgi:hypothetical protein
VALFLAIPLLITAKRAKEEVTAYQEQLGLARAEGIPTSAEEYRATIPSASVEENAAPLYRRLPELLGFDRAGAETAMNIVFKPSPNVVAEAERLLAQNRRDLDIVDEAASKPRCWFDRPWEEGAAVSMPEFSRMKGAAKFLALRGSLAMHRGDVEDALADIRKIFVMGDHAGEEPQPISHLVRESIYFIGMRQLTHWIFVHRDRIDLRTELERAVERFPKPNLKEEHSSNLYSILSLVELSETPEGIKKLGLKEGELPKGPLAKIFPMLLSKSKSRIEIVAAQRDYWAALDKPRAQKAKLLEAANTRLVNALFAFPAAAHLYHMFAVGTNDSFTLDRYESWEARLQLYRGFSRMIVRKPIPKSLEFPDLKSPFDGKPLGAKFDGSQIEITVSGMKSKLTVPPTAAAKAPSD